MAQETDTPTDELHLIELADWRRRVADLYAAVRVEARLDPEAAWRRWRDAREDLFRSHSQSPLLEADRAAFRAHHWPYDLRWRFECVVEAEDGEDEEGGRGRDSMLSVAAEPLFGGLTISLPVSTGGDESLERIGSITVPFEAGPRRLGLYWMSGYAGGLFLPFGDATNGRATYGAGRYLLDAAKSADLGPGQADGSLVLDFNFSFHPSCAFDPRWSCPLTPPENRLDLTIEAGERLR
jgi:uncharacterized protein